MSDIVVWGVQHGKCMPASGIGFREQFSNAADADIFISMKCRAVPRGTAHHYAIYITNEFCSLDRLMHRHNWGDTDHYYRDEDSAIKKVDILEIKDAIDLAYQQQRQAEDQAKLRIKSEVNNMSNEEYHRNKRLFEEVKLNVDGN